MAMQAPTEPEDGQEIEHAVLAYLHAHPEAADTRRGIAEWWLPRQRRESSSGRMTQALDRLVAAGVLHSDRLPDGDVLYALAPAAKSRH